MADSICEVPNCTARTYNFCGKCGVGTCANHSVEVPEIQHEEGYVCPECAKLPDVFPLGARVRLMKLADDDLGDEACPIVVGVHGTVINDPDGENGEGLCVKWTAPLNDVTWTVPFDCVEKVS